MTVSDDATLRIWDIKLHKQVLCIDLKIDETGKQMPVDAKTKEHSKACMGRSVDVNPKGDKIAIGMRDGSMRIYSIDKTGKAKLTYKK